MKPKFKVGDKVLITKPKNGIKEWTVGVRYKYYFWNDKMDKYDWKTEFICGIALDWTYCMKWLGSRQFHTKRLTKVEDKSTNPHKPKKLKENTPAQVIIESLENELESTKESAQAIIDSQYDAIEKLKGQVEAFKYILEMIDYQWNQ